jgi:hypothetical protein
MDATEILDQLTHAESLPKAALEAASAQRAEMLSIFLHEIDSYLSLTADDRAKPSPLFFIFHLLGEWREKAAYHLLAQLLRRPGDEVEAVLGGAITMTTHRVMAAVFDGDPRPLYEIIHDPDADQFVRSRMCETLAMAALQGDLERAVVAGFLRDAFVELQPQAQCFVWQGWQSAITMLGLSELKILVKRIFDIGFIDPQCLGYEDFQRNLEWAIKRPGEPRHRGDKQFTLFGNTVDELSGWYCFSDDYLANRQQPEQRQAETEFEDSEPYRNPLRGVGRNALCPCGSGKKFKNCCLP